MADKTSIKYCFFMTGNEPWLGLAKEMHDEGVASPILWLGDDVHFAGARALFGESVVRMLDFVHRPLTIPSVQYNGEYSEFFESHDYLDAKDICLKMMDRLDLNGIFSRIDREVYFHKLLIWALKFFYDSKPDAMLMIEKPHSHAQYLIYRIGCFLGVPAAHFKDCSLMPVNFLQSSSGEYIESSFKTSGHLKTKIDLSISAYVKKISSLSRSRKSFSPHYMVKQQKDDRAWAKLRELFGKRGYQLVRDFVSDIKFFTDQNYKAPNPFRLLFLTRELIKIKRKRNLKRAVDRLDREVNFERRYFYFPLHYEPERTTNPDGENYHDQFKAIVLLREFLPQDIQIVVKEHPSQILMADRGSRGRSPLFYDLLESIAGITVVSPAVDSFELMRNSWCCNHYRVGCFRGSLT